MKVLKELKLKLNKEDKIIFFGIPDSQKELDDMFRLRFKIYSKKNYIDKDKYCENKEIDLYDKNNLCDYFIAKLDDKIIGTIRLIKSDTLPTEKDFSFTEPDQIKEIPRENRGELSRFIITPPSEKGEIFLPARLVMLVMFSTLINYGVNNSILGGYSFIKKSLEKKMEKIGFPFHKIKDYKLEISNTNTLYKYYINNDDPVIPIYFITNEFKIFIEKILNNNLIFTRENNTLTLNDNVYTKFLKLCNVI